MFPSSDSPFDVVVAGAGPAGLNAALVLGRARRQVLLVDADQPRNAASHSLHGFLSRDGLDPAEFRRIGRLQLEAYVDVQSLSGIVEDVTRAGESHFRVTVPGRGSIETRKVLFAVGIKDDLPQIEGFDPLYGSSAFHCPYCDGWEVRDQPVAVISEEPSGCRAALLLLAWCRNVVLCTHGPSQLSAEQRAHLAAQGVVLDERRIACLEGTGGQVQRLIFADGSSLSRRALFFHGAARLSTTLPARIGCALTELGRIAVDEAGRTSVAGIYAAGDAARRHGQHPATQVILAAASGALAAIAVHQDLMYEDVGLTPALPYTTTRDAAFANG